MVFLKKCFDPLHVCPRKILKKALESSWVHGPQKHARLRANVLEGVYHIFGYEDERPGGSALDAVAELEVELSADDIKEFILRAMDVQGRSTW